MPPAGIFFGTMIRKNAQRTSVEVASLFDLVSAMARLKLNPDLGFDA